jgi:hypothetical protein
VLFGQGLLQRPYHGLEFTEPPVAIGAIRLKRTAELGFSRPAEVSPILWSEAVNKVRRADPTNRWAEGGVRPEADDLCGSKYCTLPPFC